MDFNSIADTVGGFLSENYMPLVLSGQALATWQRNQSARKVQQQQQAYVDAENARAAALAAEANQAFNTGLGQFTPAAQTGKMNSIADVYAQRMMPKETVTPEAEYTSEGAPKAVRDAAERTINEGRDKAKKYAGTGAALAGAAGLGLETNLGLGRMSQAMALPNSFAASSRALLPMEMGSAVLEGRNNRTAADILDGASSIGLLYGLTQKRKPPVPGVQDGGGYQSVFKDLR